MMHMRGWMVLASGLALGACQIKHPSCDPYQGEKQFTGITMLTKEMASKATPCVKQPVPTSYCYKVQSDVLCYRDPRAVWEGRLIGRQPTTRADMNSRDPADFGTSEVDVAPVAPVSAAPFVPPTMMQQRPNAGPAMNSNGAAAEAARLYVSSPAPVAPSTVPSYGNSASFGGSSVIGGSATRASTASSGPRVLMPNP
jgi:hypothetical protein